VLGQPRTTQRRVRKGRADEAAHGAIGAGNSYWIGRMNGRRSRFVNER
jgi:hypothetical protein